MPRTVFSLLALAAAGSALADGSEPVAEQVVVVGTKRSQAVQQALQAVSVIGERDAIGLPSALDAASTGPNVTRQSAGFLPTVRGLDGNGVALGGNGAVTGAQPRMANYIDGVARTYGATPDGQGSLWDLAQLEVLRGSQSTLLGQNALAGAIVQSTRDPVFRDEAALRVGAHDARSTAEGAFMLNRALGEQFALRLAGEAIDGRNAIDYAGFTGSGLSAADRDDLGRVHYTRLRLKALYAPGEATALKLTLERERRRNPYTQDLASAAPRRAVTTGSYGWFDADTRVAALDLQHEIDREWRFAAVLSRQKASTRFGPPVVGRPDPADFLDFRFDSTETALEPRFVYQARQGRGGAVVGAYLQQRDRQDLGQPGSVFALTADDRARSRSLFTDATLQLAEAWDLLAAARWVDDRQRRDFSALGGALAYAFDEGNRLLLPKLGLTWHAGAEASFSVLGHGGYTASGGGVSFVTFTPYRYRKETARTLEWVARTQWLDRRLTANANLFFTRLHDTQVSGIGPAGANDSIIVNIARAHTRGLELDLGWRPDARQRYGVALGLLDARIDDFGSAANSAKNGNRLPHAPRLTAQLSASVELLPALLLGGRLEASGARFSNPENLAEDRLPGHGLAHLNLQYRLGRVTLTAYVNNVFDKLVQFSRATAYDQANVNDPRTLGASVKAAF